MQRVTEGNKVSQGFLQGVTGGYMGLQSVTGNYSRLLGIAKGNTGLKRLPGLQGVTKGNKGLQGVTRSYRR